MSSEETKNSSQITRRRFLKDGLASVIVAVVGGVGGFLALQGAQPPTTPQPAAPATPTPTPTPVAPTTPTPTPVPATTPTAAPPPPTTPTPVLRSFMFTVQDKTSPWSFVSESRDNPTINVNVGDTVEITLMNDGQLPHTWTLDVDSPSPYNTDTGNVEAGESGSVSFVADKAGTFTYYCKVPGHRDLGMKGDIVIS